MTLGILHACYVSLLHQVEVQLVSPTPVAFPPGATNRHNTHAIYQVPFV
jgi:hypothetical protein